MIHLWAAAVRQSCDARRKEEEEEMTSASRANTGSGGQLREKREEDAKPASLSGFCHGSP